MSRMSSFKNVFKRKKSVDTSSLGSTNSLRNSVNSFENGNMIPYSIDEKSMSPFFKAVWRGEIEKVKKLMKSNYNKIDKDKRSALHLAAAKGNLAIIKELVNNYNNEIMELTDIEKKTALFKAVERGILENVKWIFQKSSNKNPIDIHGNTLIHACVIDKNVELLNFLLEHGQLSCDVKNKEGLYPLHICAEKSFITGIDKILKYTKHVDVYDNQSRTPLIKATIKGDIDCVRKLLMAKSDVFLYDDEGHKASYYADFYNYEKISNEIRHIERTSEKFRTVTDTYDEVDSAEPEAVVTIKNESNGSIHSEIDDRTKTLAKKKVHYDSRENSLNESEMDNSRINPPKEFLEEISTPTSSFPNPSYDLDVTRMSLNRSGPDVTHVSINDDDNNDDQESIWNDSDDDEYQTVVPPSQRDKTKMTSKNPEINIEKATPINTDDNSEWDSPESSEAHPIPAHGKSLPNMSPSYNEVSPDRQQSLSTISTANYSINAENEMSHGNYVVGGFGEEIITKSPVQYENSQDLLDDDDEDDDEEDTYNDINATVIPNAEYSSPPHDTTPFNKKPPKSPSNLKDMSDDYHDMNGVSGTKSQTGSKWKQPAAAVVGMADNLSYTSTEMDSKQNSIIECEVAVKDEHKSHQDYQKKCFNLESQLRSLKSDKEELLQQIESLNQVKESSDKQRSELQLEKRKTEESLKDRELELIEAKAKFSTAEEQLEKREEELKRLEQSKQDAEKQFKEAERNTILANSKIKQMQEEIESLHNEMSEFSGSKSEFEEYRNSMERTKQELEKSNHVLESKIQDLEAEIKHTSDRSTRNLSEEQQENDNLRRKVRNLEDDGESKEAEVKQLKETIKKLNSDLEYSSKQSAHTNRLESELKDLRKESDELHKKMRELERENEDLQQSFSKAEKDKRMLNERIGSNDEYHDRDKERMDQYQSDLRRTENQLKDLEWTLETRDKELNESNNKMKQLEIEIEKLQDNNQNIIENLNKTIDTAIVHHSDSPELLDILQGIRKQAVQIKMGDDKLSADSSTNATLELIKAKSRIKSLEEELDRKQEEYQRSISDLRSTMSNLDGPDFYNTKGMVPVDEKKFRNFSTNIDNYLRCVRDMLRVEKQRVELLQNTQENNQRVHDRQNKNLAYKNQECTRLTDINYQLNQSIKEEKLKSQQNSEKEKGLSNQLRLEVKRSKNLRDILESIKEILEKFNKDLDYPVNLMADPTIVASTDACDLENGFLSNLPRLSTRMLDYLKERNDSLQDNIRKLELKNTSRKSSGDHLSPDNSAESTAAAATLLNNQISQLTHSMESQRQNRERLDKIRDESEYQLRNELYQLRQKSTLEVNELLDSNTALEKEKHRLQNEIRSLSDALERERQSKDTLTEQLVNLVKQQPQHTPANSVYATNSNGGSQMMLNTAPGLGHLMTPYQYTAASPPVSSSVYHPQYHSKHTMSSSMFNISAGHPQNALISNTSNLEDAELREQLKHQLDKSIARHLASGKPISQLNIKDKLRSLNTAKFGAS